MSKNFLHVWDFSKSKTSKALKVSSPGPFAVTPDGSKIVTADGRVIDAKTGEVAAIDNLQGNITGLKFSPDGHNAAFTGDESRFRRRQARRISIGQMLCEIPKLLAFYFRRWILSRW